MYESISETLIDAPERADEIMRGLTPQARRRIVEITAREGLTRKTRRATATIIRHDAAIRRNDARRRWNKIVYRTAMSVRLTKRIVHGKGPLPGMTREQFDAYFFDGDVEDRLVPAEAIVSQGEGT